MAPSLSSSGVIVPVHTTLKFSSPMGEPFISHWKSTASSFRIITGSPSGILPR